MNFPYRPIEVIDNVISDIDNDTIDIQNGYGDPEINTYLLMYIYDDEADKNLIKKKITERIERIKDRTLGLHELKRSLVDKENGSEVQIRYESGELKFFTTLKEAHQKWEESKNRRNKVWKISWRNKENNKSYDYRIVYNDEENKWDNDTVYGLSITSYTLKEFKEFCELN